MAVWTASEWRQNLSMRGQSNLQRRQILLETRMAILTSAKKGQAAAEDLIRQRVENWAMALRAKDIDRLIVLYAPDIISFDLDPPLRYSGTDNKRRAWEEFFALHTGVIAYEIGDLNVTTQGELAFVHGLNHVSSTLANGRLSDLWVRWTACFRRIDGAWLVVHDHVSVPADLAHGRVVTTLTP